MEWGDAKNHCGTHIDSAAFRKTEKKREMSFTMEVAQAQIEQMIKEARWEEALVVCRRMADELHEDPSLELRVVLEHVRSDSEQLRAEDTSSSLWLLGTMHYLGWGGVHVNYEEAFRCFSRATEKGHLLSRFMAGFTIRYGLGVARDAERGHALMVEAAQVGCPAAFFDAGQA